MVIFDQLRISDDATELFISAHVNSVIVPGEGVSDTEPYKNVYITDVVVVDASSVTDTTISDIESKISEADNTAVSTNIASSLENNYLFWKSYNQADKVKEISLKLDVSHLIKHNATNVKDMDFCSKDMLKTLFIVFIKTTDTASACLPCYMNKPVTTGVTFDENMLFQNVMNYTRELADDCNIPKGFIDFILRWNAFKAAVETEHYDPAIKYYNMLFNAGYNGSSSTTVTKGCGCHG